MVHFVQPKELKNEDIILDLRTKSEYDAIRIGLPHIWIPLEELNPKQFIENRRLSPETPINLLCRSGKRAAVAAQMFADIGHPNVFVIEGGILNAMNQRVKFILPPEFRLI